MPYYTKVLRPDEQVVAIGHLHWTIYRRAMLLLAAALVLLAGSFWLTQGGLQTATGMLAALVAVIGLLAFVASYARRRSTEIVVTDRRVIFKRGILSRHTEEMNISKIDTVQVEQSLMGRLLGYGTLLIHGTGADIEPLQRVDQPLALRNAIVVG